MALSDVLAPLAALPKSLRRRVSAAAYRPEIDGLRFFAIAIVIVGHFVERAVRFFPSVAAFMHDNPAAELLQRPGLGVYLFFAISGFIIAGQARKARAHPLSAGFLKTYFARRVLRIEPPYVVLLAATYLLIAATGYAPEGAKQFDAAPQSLALSLGASVLYLHGLVFGTFPRLFPPGWSLEAEVQFYLVAPVLFALWFSLKRAGLRVAVAAVGLAAGALVSLTAPPALGPVHVGMGLLRFFHFFWLGLVLADAQAWIAPRVARLPAVAATALGWGGLGVYLLLPSAPEPHALAELALGMAIRAAALASVAAMFASVFAPASGFRATCGKPWIALIGGACYSLYLTHLQIIQALVSIVAKIWPQAPASFSLALGVVAVALVLAGGLAFYALVERTFMIPDWPRLAWRKLAGRGPLPERAA